MPELYNFPFSAMGTACMLQIYADDADLADRVALASISEAERIEARYSRYRSDSLLSRINEVAAHGGRIAVDEETAGLLDYAFACHAASGELFDISAGAMRHAWDFESETLPEAHAIEEIRQRIGLSKIDWREPELKFNAEKMELDFGGICKEYAVDRLVELCREHGIRSGLVDLGGDIAVIGPHPDGSPWLIGIRHPTEPGELLGAIGLGQGAIATSGDYERCITVGQRRFSHIINPLTGWPVEHLASVSVISKQCMVAGSLSTIAMLKAGEGAAWLASLGVDHLWIDRFGNQGGTISLMNQTA